MYMNNKTLTTLVLLSIVIFTVALVSSPMLNAAYASHDKGKQKSKDKPKDPKCNNVKILVKVSNIPPKTTALVGQATLNGKSVSKTVGLEDNESKVAIPLSFKKLNPCPAVGDGFSGNVNGTSFSGNLASLKTPNKVNVTLP